MLEAKLKEPLAVVKSSMESWRSGAAVAARVMSPVWMTSTEMNPWPAEPLPAAVLAGTVPAAVACSSLAKAVVQRTTSGVSCQGSDRL